jgi:hypothetical protein
LDRVILAAIDVTDTRIGYGRFIIDVKFHTSEVKAV